MLLPRGLHALRRLHVQYVCTALLESHVLAVTLTLPSAWCVQLIPIGAGQIYFVVGEDMQIRSDSGPGVGTGC